MHPHHDPGAGNSLLLMDCINVVMGRLYPKGVPFSRLEIQIINKYKRVGIL